MKNNYKCVVIDGTKLWYLNSKLHRDDGPAVEVTNGRREWYRNGKRHRDSGPAIEFTDGTKMWCCDGRLHREDGPAIEWNNGNKEWYLDGYKCTFRRFLEKIDDPNKKIMLALANTFGGFDADG